MGAIWHCYDNLTANSPRPGPSSGWGRGVSYPAPRDVWMASPSARNSKNTPKCTTLKKFFFWEGPRENVWGLAKMFPRAPLWLSTGLSTRDFRVCLWHWTTRPPNCRPTLLPAACCPPCKAEFEKNTPVFSLLVGLWVWLSGLASDARVGYLFSTVTR